MPKLKTHKGTSKRVKVTATGKLLRRCQKRNHLLFKKSKTLKRRTSKDMPFARCDIKKIKKLIPNSL